MLRTARRHAREVLRIECDVFRLPPPPPPPRPPPLRPPLPPPSPFPPVVRVGTTAHVRASACNAE
eukprot:309051-Pyramimonas_sp.AAC.1